MYDNDINEISLDDFIAYCEEITPEISQEDMKSFFTCFIGRYLKIKGIPLAECSGSHSVLGDIIGVSEEALWDYCGGNCLASEVVGKLKSLKGS